MAPYPLDKQTASCNSPYNWLMSLAMGLALYDSYIELKIAPMDAVYLFPC